MGVEREMTPEEVRGYRMQPAAQTAQAVAVAMDKQRQLREAQILYLTMLTQNGPVTETTSPISGDYIEAGYTAIFRNDTNNPVRVQAFADFTNPGVGAILSLSSDASDAGKIDTLSLTANGRTESVTTIILPTFSLWAKDFDPQFFPMQGNDVLRLRVFDPAKLLSYWNLYPKF
jgi:hypothetical protein